MQIPSLSRHAVIYIAVSTEHNLSVRKYTFTLVPNITSLMPVPFFHSTASPRSHAFHITKLRWTRLSDWHIDPLSMIIAFVAILGSFGNREVGKLDVQSLLIVFNLLKMSVNKKGTCGAYNSK